MKLLIKLFLTCLLFNTFLPLQASDLAANITALSPDEMIDWGTPKTLSVGAQDYVLHGNPEKRGIYSVRLKLPANYKIPPDSSIRDNLHNSDLWKLSPWDRRSI